MAMTDSLPFRNDRQSVGSFACWVHLVNETGQLSFIKPEKVMKIVNSHEIRTSFLNYMKFQYGISVFGEKISASRESSLFPEK